MFKKTLLAAAALAVTGSAAFAGGYDHYRVNYNNYSYQPQYKTVCEPVYETKLVYDSYSYRYITQQVFVGNKCYLVRIH